MREPSVDHPYLFILDRMVLELMPVIFSHSAKVWVFPLKETA